MGCAHSTRAAAMDPLPPPRPIVDATTHAYGGSPRASSPSTTKPTQPLPLTTQHSPPAVIPTHQLPPAMPAQPRAASNPTPSSTPPKPRPKLLRPKSQPQIVNLRTADQVLTSPSQVAYPNMAYILGLTTRKKQQQHQAGVGRTEVGEGRRNVPGVVVTKPEQFGQLTAKRAADEYHAPLPRSPSPTYKNPVSAPRTAGSSGGSETGDSMSQRASGSSRPSVETAWSSGDSLYMDVQWLMSEMSERAGP